VSYVRCGLFQPEPCVHVQSSLRLGTWDALPDRLSHWSGWYGAGLDGVGGAGDMRCSFRLTELLVRLVGERLGSFPEQTFQKNSRWLILGARVNTKFSGTFWEAINVFSLRPESTVVQIMYSEFYYMNNTFFFFLAFSRQGFFSLCSPGCPGTHSVDQAGLELRNLPASWLQVLGLKACTTTAQHG
jgi:hypothetical protein